MGKSAGRAGIKRGKAAVTSRNGENRRRTGCRESRREHRRVHFLRLLSGESQGSQKCLFREGLESRKEHKPKNNAVDMAAAMGIELLTEDQYRALQELGDFDTKTSSWVKTPPDIRKLGGALFCDRRYGHVFTYHNGAQSYYAARGFRGALRV